MLKDDQRPVLVFINLSGIGDLLMSLKLIFSLQKDYRVLPIIPKKYGDLTDILIKAGLMEEHLTLDGSIRFRSDPMSHLKLLKKINRLNPQIVLIYGKEIMAVSAFLGLIKANHFLICMPSLSHFSFLKYSNLLVTTGNRLSDYRQFAEHLGISTELPISYLSGKIKSQLEKEPNDVLLPERYAVVAPWTSSPKRDPPLSFFKRCIEIIHTEHNLPVVLTGQSRNQKAAQKIQEELPDSAVINLVGKTKLNNLFKIIEKASFLVSNDSGSMHIAILLGIPSLIVFTPITSRKILENWDTENVMQISKFAPIFWQKSEFMKKIDWRMTRKLISRACRKGKSI